MNMVNQKYDYILYIESYLYSCTLSTVSIKIDLTQVVELFKEQRKNWLSNKMK